MPFTVDGGGRYDDYRIICVTYVGENEEQRNAEERASQLSQSDLLLQNDDGDSYVVIDVTHRPCMQSKCRLSLLNSIFVFIRVGQAND